MCTFGFSLGASSIVKRVKEGQDVVLGVLAGGEEGGEGVRGGRRASRRDAPIEGGLALLGDGDAVFEEAEG